MRQGGVVAFGRNDYYYCDDDALAGRGTRWYAPVGITPRRYTVFMYYRYSRLHCTKFILQSKYMTRPTLATKDEVRHSNITPTPWNNFSSTHGHHAFRCHLQFFSRHSGPRCANAVGQGRTHLMIGTRASRGLRSTDPRVICRASSAKDSLRSSSTHSSLDSRS